MKIRTYRLEGFYEQDGKTIKIGTVQMAQNRTEAVKMIEEITKNIINEATFHAYTEEEMEYDTQTKQNKYIGKEIWTWPQQ